MRDFMNEIEKFSPFGGQLILEEVAGSGNQTRIAENSVSTGAGADRDMYSYVPKSGCPDAKQCQVLMVLRSESSKESAEKVLKELQLDKLAEERHFVVLFPNPQQGGWNYLQEEGREDDCSFLVRCFAALPKSKGGVAGFNGMIFYIGTDEQTNAMLAVLSATHPIDCAALMVGKFPQGFCIPEGVKQPQVAWVYEENKALESYLDEVNAPSIETWEEGVSVTINKKNRNIRHFVSKAGLSADEVRKAWDRMFSETRRWRNDTYGTYQQRTNFSEEGFVSHIKDTSLGVNDGFAHTWFEYYPPQVLASDEKVPLLFYFHGGGCIPLYGAEQSDWHRIAKKEGFIVVYPKASIEKRWNCWDELDDPSDFEFVMALIEHVKKVHPIDETRIYISGFSMGSMMTNALACAYPEVFAAGAPCNAQHMGYFNNLKSSFANLAMGGQKYTEEELNAISHCRIMADEKKARQDYRFPLIQNSGLLDGLGARGWPIASADNPWVQTFDYWKKYNNIPVTEFNVNDEYPTGLTADESFYEYQDERFIHHKWYSDDPEHLPLYQVLVAKRMPHALDLRQIEIAWEFMKHYSRKAGGTLVYTEEV
ncbi:MAG: prolyl oligopeptidase family serine peptidase [Erysipelotrichaceae bacterium]|nr:prolyl oligopeptidase family serine peptidase [Erysipelotrichaceae bacterium]